MQNEKVVGYCQFEGSHFGPFGVAKDFQGRGIGTVLQMPYDASHLSRLHALKEINPDLKILVSAGGWSWSGNFSDAALTSESRKQFAQSVVDMIREHNLDGIDIDWEYPGQIGAGNVYRPEDKQNFTLLLRDVRRKLEEMSDVDDCNRCERSISGKYRDG